MWVKETFALLPASGPDKSDTRNTARPSGSAGRGLGCLNTKVYFSVSWLADEKGGVAFAFATSRFPLQQTVEGENGKVNFAGDLSIVR